MGQATKNMTDNTTLGFDRAIKEVEDMFLREKEGNLYRFILTTVEKPLIERVLDKTQGNQLKAAKILGINRNTLRSKIRKLGIVVRK